MIPKIENIHQKVLGAVSKENSLDMHEWHTCETTHCRAGWVITLAGEEGEALEEYFGSFFAAQLIYRESSPIAVPLMKFFDNNEDALQDIKRMAELELQSLNIGEKYE